jgi:hypothetical protein
MTQEHISSHIHPTQLGRDEKRRMLREEKKVGDRARFANLPKVKKPLTTDSVP